eukprot:1079354-Rhodomonas_salina.1
MVSRHTVKQEAAPVSPKRQRNKEGKKTRKKAKHAFDAKIEEYKGRCVSESMKIISNWNVFCHSRLHRQPSEKSRDRHTQHLTQPACVGRYATQ